MKGILNKNFKNVPSSRYYRFKELDKKDKIKKIKFWGFLFLILIVFLTLNWLVFLSSLFDIRNISTSDSNYLSNNEIEKNIADIAFLGLKKNLLVLSGHRLSEKLTAAFPMITDIIVKKTFFHTITINFQKRIPLGIWCNDNNCYFFDKEGIAFAEAPQTEGSLILKIEDKSKNNISIGDDILNSNQINFLVTFINKISENDKLKILEFKIKPNSSVNLEAVTDRNWSIYLDENQDPTATINNLLIIIKEAIKNTNNLEYIDLRIPSRVFYKLK